MEKKRLLKALAFNLIALTLIFLALYHSFLFDGKMYAYTDIGLDTVDQYLPGMVYEIEAMKESLSGTYDLQYGFGKYSDNYLIKYLNPLNLPILLFGSEQLHIGLLVSLYVKYVVICVFAFLFFLRLVKQEAASSICAQLWTFSGYAVLWGQHYQFLTAIAAFTVAVYGFQLFLEDDRKRILVIPSVAFLAITSYYHLYICCYFFFAYGIIFLALKGNSVAQILKKAGKFVLVLIFALCIAGAYILPAVGGFFSSTRTNQVSDAFQMKEVIYPIGVLLSFAARLFSNNLIGVGNNFSGFGNYYECAILSVSVLSVFSFVYLLQGESRGRLCGIVLACLLWLATPVSSKLMVFTADTQRWTYLLCFAQTIMIGIALSHIFTHTDRAVQNKRLLRSALISDVIVAFVLLLLFFYDRRRNPGFLDLTACNIVLLTIVGYHIVILLTGKWYKNARIFFTIMVIAELIFTNYATVNDRAAITVSQWNNDLYNDGTEEVVEWIQEQDPSVYRINKLYNSFGESDALVQGYNGLAVYGSVNTSELLALVKTYGYTDVGNHIRISGSDLLANTMLGVKYIITEEDTQLNSDYYELVYDNGTYQVYKNRFWMGFGYLYPEEFGLTQPKGKTVLEKLIHTADGYYFTADATHFLDSENVEKMDILPYLTECRQCVVDYSDTLHIGTLGVDMQLYFDLPELNEGMVVSGLEIRMNAQTAASMRLMTASDTGEFDWDMSDVLSYGSGDGVYHLDNMLLDDVSRIRLDISWIPQNMEIESIHLILVDEADLQRSMSELQTRCISDIRQDADAFRLSVSNGSDSDAMLCVPVVFSEFWRAYVNGESVDIQNINGGLLGIVLAPGDHSVELRYENNAQLIGNFISAVSIAAYVAMLCIQYINKQKYRRKTS